VINAYSPLESSTNPTSKSSSIQTFTKTLSMSLNLYMVIIKNGNTTNWSNTSYKLLDKELKLMPISWLPLTSQTYKLHRFVPNLCKIYYFIGLYCLHTNDMHYLNTKVTCTTFGREQHKYIYNIHV
jgi:hypothetical protein